MRVLVAFDVFWNVVFDGAQDQTISSRAALAMRAHKRWGCVLCRVLDWLEKNHCIEAIVNDTARAEFLVQIELRKAALRAKLLAEKA